MHNNSILYFMLYYTEWIKIYISKLRNLNWYTNPTIDSFPHMSFLVSYYEICPYFPKLNVLKLGSVWSKY